jgi:hypothetical protein
MAVTKMAEIHVNITSDSSGNQVVFHNSAQVPLAVGAGQSVSAASKTAGSPNGIVHGQVNAGGSIPGPIIHNPA